MYDSLVTSIGANANAYTTDDYTAYHLNFAKEDLEKVIELESDRFQNLRLRESSPFRRRPARCTANTGRTSPVRSALLNEKMQDLAYDVHTYKHTTIGFEADIKAMPEAYDYSKSFFQRFYRPENVVLVITGDIDPEATMALVTKYYGGWQKGYVPPKIVPEPPQKKERTAEISYPGQTLPIIDIAYKGDAFDPDNTSYVAALVLGDLAFGETTDLYKKLYVKQQKVEFIAPNIPMNRDLPLFEIYSMVKKTDDVDYVRDEVYKTLEEYKTKPVDEKRLNDLKKRQKYGFLMGLDTPDHVAGGLARFVAMTGGIEVIDRLYTKLRPSRPQDIMAAAQKYFTPERRTVVVLKGAQ